MGQYTERVDRLQRQLADRDADGAIVATGPNARYLTGFAGEGDRHLLCLVQRDGPLTLVSPESYVGQVAANTEIGDVASVLNNTAESVVEGLASALPDLGGRYLIDDEAAAGETCRLKQVVPDAAFDLLGPALAPMRARKDPRELDALRRAASLTDDVSVATREVGADAVGMTERELAVDIRARLAERGIEGVAFPVVVAAGPNGARPMTHRHGDHEIRAGEPVVLDFGGFFDGYASDQTRSVVFDGEPAETFVEAHRVVREAIEAGVDAAEPGMTGDELDAVVRDIVEAAGYGDEFLTGTGHGVGLRGHEPPSISPGSNDELAEGMVFSIEPGIYVEGEFGVRLETLVALTDEEARALNTSPYTWKPL